MPGPLPKHPSQRRRNNRAPGIVPLPAAGRSGPTPTWPLAAKPTREQLLLWAELWQRPQAVAWERFRLGRIAARYAVIVTAVEADPTPTLAAECRHLEELLGLTPAALIRVRWEIETADPPAPVAAIADYRSMFDSDSDGGAS